MKYIYSPEERFMKKIAALLCILTMLLLSCCADKDAASEQLNLDKYNEYAAKLSVITLDSEYDIVCAESAYKKLSDEQKQTVSDEVIVEARKILNNMLALKDMLPELCVTLENVFAPNNGAALSEFKEDLEKANEYIGSLTAEQQKEISEIDRFLEAKAKYEAPAADAQSLAELYAEAFLEYKNGEDVTVTDIACIVNSLNGEMGYFYGLKYKTASEEKTVYSHVKMDKTFFKDAIVGHAAAFFNEEPIKNYNVFECGNYTVTLPQ